MRKRQSIQPGYTKSGGNRSRRHAKRIGKPVDLKRILAFHAHVSHLPRTLLSAVLLLTAILLPSAPGQAKTWTDITGRTLDAEYVSSDGAIVILKSNATGKEIRVPLERLSLPDKAAALFKLHEQKSELASALEAPDSPEGAVETPRPGSPAASSAEATALELPAKEEELVDFIGDNRGGEPDVMGGFTAFAQPMKAGQYADVVRSMGWAAVLLGMLFQIVLAVLIAAVGIHITSIFLDFKETFGTALMLALGSTGFRCLIEYSQAAMAWVSPSLVELLDSPLVRWMTIIGVIYPFDAFLIRRIYRADMGTAMRAAVAYVLWGRVMVLLIGVLIAAAVTSGGGGDMVLPPGLGE